MAEFPLIAFARECVIGACLTRHDRVEPRYQGRFAPNTGYAPVSGFLRRINFGSGWKNAKTESDVQHGAKPAGLTLNEVKRLEILSALQQTPESGD